MDGGDGHTVGSAAGWNMIGTGDLDSSEPPTFSGERLQWYCGQWLMAKANGTLSTDRFGIGGRWENLLTTGNLDSSGGIPNSVPTRHRSIRHQPIDDSAAGVLEHDVVVAPLSKLPVATTS